MLQLRNISLIQFRNYVQHSFQFSQNIVGICGQNGVGKTNLLDAIYYLSFCKSYFNRSDSSNVNHDLQGFRVEGNYLLNNKNISVTCIVRENNKKEFLLNNDEYKKLSEHIGKLPCVMIAPDDVELITGSSELRRKFIDVILSQINDSYLQHLIAYNNLLLQRNSMLKQYATSGNLDDVLFNIITEQFATKGTIIFQIRIAFLQNFLPTILSSYHQIANTNDALVCNYQSQLFNNNFLQLLQQNLQIDMLLQRTNIGIHKDDIEILMGSNKFKTEASQGQRKSLLFAFKLSEWQIIQQDKGFPPILLLDDVFEKLDAERMNNLLQIVSSQSDAQIFITDTHKDRLEHQLATLNKDFEIIEI
jgi:DNA replication and repair protein RecF